MTVSWIDSHCHLDFSAFDDDRHQVVAAARHAGMKTCIIPGVHPQQWPIAETIAKAFQAYFTIGIHPYFLNKALAWSGDGLDDVFDGESPCVNHPLCVGLGEMGLDARLDTPLDVQENVFDNQLACAKALGKPVIIHSVRSHQAVTQRLRSLGFSRGVIHAFSGSYQEAKQLVDLGFHLGIGGTITYERANKTRETVAKLPLDCMVLETDSPDMPNKGYQGQRNEPVRLLDVAQSLAQLKKLPVESVLQVTCAQTQRVFAIT